MLTLSYGSAAFIVTNDWLDLSELIFTFYHEYFVVMGRMVCGNMTWP